MNDPWVITAPQALIKENGRPIIYLGGTIDMGDSEDWQAQIVERLADEHVLLLNPRRRDWDADWLPVAEDPHFRQQAKWELAALEAADVIVLYLASGSQSPISLLELGLHARTGKLIVFCARDYFRKGNIDLTAERYGIEQATSFEDLVERVKRRLTQATVD